MEAEVALYLSEQLIKDAVVRLGVSAAGPNIGDYLVFKRAFKLSRDLAKVEGRPAPVSVVTGTRSIPFLQAHVEVGLRLLPERVISAVGDDDLLNCMQILVTGKKGAEAKDRDTSLTAPYFVPFGALRDSSYGYRQAKWPSNGPSDTVNRWQSRSKKPLLLVPDSSPKEYQFQALTEKEFSRFFSIESASSDFSGEKPRISDVAIWWFRFTELLDRFGAEPTVDDLLVALGQDLEFSEIESAGLFHQGRTNGASELSIAESAEPYIAESDQPYLVQAIEPDTIEVGMDLSRQT